MARFIENDLFRELKMCVGLRAMDALHLSTALLYGEAMTAMATFDRELEEAAQKFGLETVAGVS